MKSVGITDFLADLDIERILLVYSVADGQYGNRALDLAFRATHDFFNQMRNGSSLGIDCNGRIGWATGRRSVTLRTLATIDGARKAFPPELHVAMW